MEHFSLEQWADFARNVMKEKDKIAMQAHLDTGCKRCASALSTWTHVSVVAQRERALQPPEGTVSSAKALLAIHGRPAKSPITQLLFDSFQSPALAGVRSTATVPRQLLYGHGNYRIDVHMEPRFDSDKVSLIGQVLNSAEPTERLSQVPVALLKGRKVVTRSITNEFGEFQLECDLKGSLQIQLALPRGATVRIPLLEPSRAALTGDSQQSDSKAITKDSSLSGKRTRKRV
jgi:hypothetical protein